MLWLERVLHKHTGGGAHGPPYRSCNINILMVAIYVQIANLRPTEAGYGIPRGFVLSDSPTRPRRESLKA
jgi:hypothetical protein